MEGWDESPPTNILVKALVQGFGGTVSKPRPIEDIPPDKLKEMQESAMAGIRHKAGNRVPIIRGKDKGLPKTAPVFDVETLRQRNAALNMRLKDV